MGVLAPEHFLCARLEDLLRLARFEGVRIPVRRLRDSDNTYRTRIVERILNHIERVEERLWTSR